MPDPIKDLTKEIIEDDLLLKLQEPGFIKSLPLRSKLVLASGVEGWLKWEQKRRAEERASYPLLEEADLLRQSLWERHRRYTGEWLPPEELSAWQEEWNKLQALEGKEPSSISQPTITAEPSIIYAEKPPELSWIEKAKEFAGGAGGFVSEIGKSLIEPVFPEFYRTQEEQRAEELKNIAEQYGLQEPTGEVSMRAVGELPPTRIPELEEVPMGLGYAGAYETPGERIIGEWVAPLLALGGLGVAATPARQALIKTAEISPKLATRVAAKVGEKVLGLGLGAGGKPKVFKPKFPEIQEFPVYTERLRRVHPERFRAKTDIDSAFKDIQQSYLATREIAQNAPSPLMADLTKQGRSADLFKFGEIKPGLYDVTIQASYIKPKVKGASMAFGDIAQNPSNYQFVGKEGQRALKFIKAYQNLEKELLRFEKKYGIPINERIYAPGEVHIGRNVVAQVDEKGNVILERTLRRGRLGTKLSAERERWYPTQGEGIKAGKVYATPEESMQFRIQSAIERAGGLKIKGQYIDALSKTPKEMMDVNIKDKWQALSRNYQDRLYIGKALQRVRRGEKLPAATLRAIENKDPALGMQIKGGLNKGEITNLIKASKVTTETAKLELRDFAPAYHRATAKARQAAFTEGRIWAFPGAQNRIFTDVANPHNPDEIIMTGREVAQKLTQIFGPERVSKELAFARDVARLGVSTVATMDFSWPFIQGPMTFGRDAIQWMQGKPSAVWFRAVYQMLKTVVNPRWFADFQVRHAATYTEAPFLVRSPMEFVSGAGILERWASVVGKIPKVGKPISGKLTWLIRQTYGRFGAAFSSPSEASRVLGYESLKPSWLKNGGDLVELQATLNELTGSISQRLLGVSAQRQAAEGAAFFAPNWLRACLMMTRDLFRGNLRAREVQKALVGLMASMTLGYVGICAALGQEPKLNPAPSKVGGDGSQFMTFQIKGQNIGMPIGWWYSLFRIAASVTAAVITEPETLIKFDTTNPVIRGVMSKLSPPVNFVHEIVTQRDYFGNRIETGGDWVRILSEHFMPIAAQNILEKRPDSDVWTGLAAGELGTRSYPVQPWEELDHMREDLASKYLDADGDPVMWDELPNMLRDEVRRHNSDFVKLEKQIDEEWALKRGTDDERAVYLLKQELEKEYLTNISTLVGSFLNGRIDGKTFRQSINDLRADRSLENDLLWRLKEIGKPEAATDYENYILNEAPLQDRYMHAYYDYWNKLIRAEGVEVDWDRVNKGMDEWLATLPSYARDYIGRYKNAWILDLPLEVQPVLTEMVSDIAYIDQSGYWVQPDVMEQRSLGLTETKDFRATQRTKDPTLDAILAFWGYTTSIKSAGAGELLKRKAQKLGRNYLMPIIP